MNSFKPNKNILFAIDTKGTSVVNKNDGTTLFIEYPEAAVWNILIEHDNTEKSLQMLMAILEKNKTETKKFISQCLKRWKSLKIIC